MSETWPVAHLDNIARLQVLAAGLAGAAFYEQVLPYDFDRVWGFFSDMERSLPAFDQAVAEFRVLSREGTRLIGKARGPRVPLHITFDVDLEPGWCWMTARRQLYVVGFAAEPVGEQTRFAHLESYNVSGPAWLRVTAERLFSIRSGALQRHVRHDVEGIASALGN